MTTYECMIMVRPTVEGEGLTKVKDAFEKVITSNDGEVLHFFDVGVRRMKYLISNFWDARYLVYYFNGGGEVVDAITNHVNLSDTILRQLVIKAEGEIPSPNVEDLMIKHPVNEVKKKTKITDKDEKSEEEKKDEEKEIKGEGDKKEEKKVEDENDDKKDEESE